MQSHFDYSCSSWYTGVSEALKNELQRTQHNTVTFIKIIDQKTSIKQIELSSLGFLDLENRMEQLRLNHAHTIFNNACPSYSKVNCMQR